MGEVKKLERIKGILTSVHIDKNYGFIIAEDGRSLFFHGNSSFKPLGEMVEGMAVSAYLIEVEKGYRAIGVEIEDRE